MDNIKPTPIHTKAFRVVEIQTRKAILKLVDADEAEILDVLLEVSKPPVPHVAEELDVLAYTPFRYPPLRHGSRFGVPTERGIWYGSEILKTAFCESAYYKFRFFEESPALRKEGSIVYDLTSFQAQISSKKGIDLCSPAFRKMRKKISSPLTYRHSQTIGKNFRSQGVEVLKFFSSRATESHVRNFAVFAPTAISKPSSLSHWICRWEADVISICAYDKNKSPQIFEFRREQYLIKGQFPII